jgi:hypothetical protein
LGQGYPFLSFYAPLLFWISGVFHRLGLDVASALKLTTSLGVLAGALGIARLLREAGARAAAGFVGAALYVYAPYSVRDIFIRGDLAEALAMGLIPWTLCGMLRLRESPTAGNAALASLAGALPILSHNILGLFNGLLMAVSGGIAILTSRTRMRTARAVVFAGIGTLAISAFFWMPALHDRRFVHIDILTQGYFEVTKHFVTWGQLLGRGEFPGVGQGLPMSFEIGWVGIGCTFLAALFARSLWRSSRALFILGVLLLLMGVARAMKVSEPLYQAVELLRYIQFPWRFLAVVALGVAVLGGLGFDRAFGRAGPWVGGITGSAIIAAAILFVFPLLGPRQNFELPSWALDPSEYQRSPETTTKGEYMPIWVEETQPLKGFENGVKLIGEGRVVRAERRAGFIEATVDSKDQAELVLQDLYFPGWTGQMDGAPLKLEPEPVTGRIRAHLPEGRHDLSFRLQATPLRRVTAVLSTAALIAALSFAILGRRAQAIGT